MCNLPEQASDAPLDPDLITLTHGMPVWHSGEASTTYIRGMLLPWLASDLYTLPSKVLMDEVAKAMVLNRLTWKGSLPTVGRLRGPTPKCKGPSTPNGDRATGFGSDQGGSPGGPTEEGDRRIQGVARVRDGSRVDGAGIARVRVSASSSPTPSSASGGRDRVGPLRHPSRGC
ncbi:hypothetical protein B296_00054970 [Ensete ventricosum]|uniref:Uncharacterized protein n=1 Tax=Ensete ventricosum TaxID=4639 RepID=A0A426WW78_ENSVE|nr:hypothetical protein B296_00054970 [Ensete ventricosum]